MAKCSHAMHWMKMNDMWNAECNASFILFLYFYDILIGNQGINVRGDVYIVIETIKNPADITFDGWLYYHDRIYGIHRRRTAGLRATHAARPAISVTVMDGWWYVPKLRYGFGPDWMRWITYSMLCRCWRIYDYHMIWSISGNFCKIFSTQSNVSSFLRATRWEKYTLNNNEEILFENIKQMKLFCSDFLFLLKFPGSSIRSTKYQESWQRCENRYHLLVYIKKYTLQWLF